MIRSFPIRIQFWTAVLGCWVGLNLLPARLMAGAAKPRSSRYATTVEPILKEFCYDCHGDGMEKGRVALDGFKSEEERLASKELWLAVLKNVRSGLMPPEKKPHPSAEQTRILGDWIRDEVFEIDPQNPDPGRITVRRLNRVEYKNTIRDLMGVEFDTELEFPADDTGHGFDNIADALTVSPMLVEKYLSAARTIVDLSVPITARVPVEHKVAGSRFRKSSGDPTSGAPTNRPGDAALSLSYYEAGVLSHTFHAPHAGVHRVKLDFNANEKHVEDKFDRNRCEVVFRVDGVELLRKTFSREPNRAFQFEFVRDWAAGDHLLELLVEPTAPAEPQIRNLSIKMNSVSVVEPQTSEVWTRPARFERFFVGDTPESGEERRRIAEKVLRTFCGKAFRQRVDEPTVKRLVDMAEANWSVPGRTFESGVGQAMVAVLASPRFLFREEASAGSRNGERFADVDEYSLASRLSYFLWSTMPDHELFHLAEQGRLRKELPGQMRRMLADAKSEAFVRSFTGQWLQARDVEGIAIDHRVVMGRESDLDPELEKSRARFRSLREREPAMMTEAEKKEFEAVRADFFKRRDRFNKFELTGDLRRAMRRETEKYFEYVLRENRSLLELLDSDYTFLNKRLAEFYGVDGVDSEELRKVTLAKDSPRGGLLTQGTVLIVTSNPTRTSPVKRGLFVLENIFGTPPPPPPPNIPALEAAKKADGKEPGLREALAIHRAEPMCSSCHNRMDPVGLAFENFNALGRWREKDVGELIDPAGRLVTGEAFSGVRELKKILVRDRREDFYRCITEKVLTYALGRGLEYHDEATLDRIVQRLETEGGKASVLLEEVILSVPFQKTRMTAELERTEGSVKKEQASVDILKK